MNIIGASTIHPFFFYSGKIIGYFLWTIPLQSLLGLSFLSCGSCILARPVAFPLMVFGISLVMISLICLGRSTRLGLPTEDTVFKKGGIYKLSRNPMYVGFNLFTLASVVYSLNFFVLLGAIYSILVYHWIILSEERFLAERFGTEYDEYKSQVRRYL